MSEASVEQYLVRAMKEIGGVCRKWVSPGTRGVPDRLCFFPSGRLVIVEMKRPSGGVLSPEQKREIARLQRLGYDVRVINTRIGVRELIAEVMHHA